MPNKVTLFVKIGSEIGELFHSNRIAITLVLYHYKSNDLLNGIFLENMKFAIDMKKTETHDALFIYHNFIEDE